MTTQRSGGPAHSKQEHRRLIRHRMWNMRALYAMIFVGVVYFVVFRYATMYGVLIAFKNFKARQGIWGSQWVGLKNFAAVFGGPDVARVFKNTIEISLMKLLTGFPAPIILAILLNEIYHTRFKKTVSSVLYMPHFLSWVIISSLALQLFAPSTGLINVVFEKLGMGTVPFLNDSTHWVFTYIFIGIWQSFGWNSIIYLAAITSIDPCLYESAAIDGAGRFQKIRYVLFIGGHGNHFFP